MEGWITFWRIVCTVAFSAFYLLVLVVIPLGAIDLVALFRHLSRDREGPPQTEESA
jgi:hypothetical protein